MYRTVDTSTWTDEWVQTLPPQARYLFVYLLTNHRVTACGALEITPGQAARETGLTRAEVESALTALAPKVQYWADLETVWIRNFFVKQRANSNNDRFTISAANALKTFAPAVQTVILATYPELRDPPKLPPSPNRKGKIQPATNPISNPSTNGYTDGIRQPATNPISHNDNSNREQRTVTETESTDRTRTHEAQQREAFDRELPPTHRDPPGTAITKQKHAPRAAPSKPLPKSYPLTEEMRVWAAQEVPELRDVDTEHAQFSRYWHSKQNETRTDWRPMWEKWMTDAVTRFAPRGASTGDVTHERSRYESPAERKEREYRESIASIYGAPAIDQGGADQEPFALPDGPLDAGIIDLDRRRLGGNPGRDPDGLARPRVPGGAAWATG